MGGPVILVNDILSVADKDMEIDLLIFQKEEIVSTLKENIHLIPWSQLTQKTKRRNFAGSLPKNMCGDYSCYTIDLAGYDKVIYYPYHAALFQVKNCNAKFYTIGMDSGPMLYLRGFLNHRLLLNRAFSFYYFLQALYIDRKAAKKSETVFTVGEADAEFYRSVYLADAWYVHHPVSCLIDGYKPIAWEENQKLKISFPGSLTRFYVQGLIEEILDLIIGRADYYKDRIEISFLQIKYKKLKQKAEQMVSMGFLVEQVDFAEDFESYLANQHLILIPLAVGAGTKNKALSVLGMGADLIGSPIAMENVYGTREEHIAANAQSFLDQIDLRLRNHKLYGLSEDEIKKFKEYHSVQNWNIHFWAKIRND